MALKYNSTPIPEVTQKAVHAIMNEHKKPVLFYSLCYLARDTVFAIICYLAFEHMKDIVPEYIRYPVYSLCMGTILFGHWILGHECGHGCFGNNRLQNDVVGFVLHTMLLTPYFSWQYSHSKHHKYTNHLIHGESHVPFTKIGARAGLTMKRRMYQAFGTHDAFAFIEVIFLFLVGWQAYLWFNSTGGRVAADMESKLDRRGKLDHFRPSSQVMPDRLATKVALSTMGCFVMSGLLVWTGMVYEYFGPYLVVNAWLILYTWLHHTDSAVPHYGIGTPEYHHMVGALCSIDRPYPWIVDQLHHHIGTTHVAHHLNYAVPHYEAVECTKKLKALLGDRYLYDPTPVWRAALNVARDCVYVDSVEGVQYYKAGDPNLQEAKTQSL